MMQPVAKSLKIILTCLPMLLLGNCYTTKPMLYLQDFSVNAVDQSFMPLCAGKSSRNWIDFYGSLQCNPREPFRMNNSDHTPVTPNGTVQTERRIDSTLNEDFLFPYYTYYTYDTSVVFTKDSREFSGSNVAWTKPVVQGNIGMAVNTSWHMTFLCDYSFATIGNQFHYKAMVGLGPHFRSGPIALRFISALGVMNSTGSVKLFGASLEPLLTDSAFDHAAVPVTGTLQVSANTLELVPFQIYWGLGYSSTRVYRYENSQFENSIQVLASFANLSFGVLRDFGPTTLQAGVMVNAHVPADLLQDDSMLGSGYEDARARYPVYPVFQMRVSRSFVF